MTNKLSALVMAFAISGLLALGSPDLLAADASLTQKLEQCEAAFKESHSKTATREQAGKARAKHLTLMIEILGDLNSANVKAADQNRPLSADELSNNVRVMGRLVKMIAEDHIASSQEWSYVY